MLSSKSILVVDDAADMTATLQVILEGHGHHVETCTNGRDALERLRTGRFNVALLDCLMPHLGGEAVAAAVRDTPALSHVAVVMMSAAPRPRNCRDATFLRKPFSVLELTNAIRAAVTRPPKPTTKTKPAASIEAAGVNV